MVNRLIGQQANRVLMLAMVIILCVSCASGPVVQTIEVTKATAESILFEARVAQNKGKITEAQFNAVREAYDKLRSAVRVAIDARIAYLMLQTLDTEQRMTEAAAAVTDFTVQLISLATQFGLINTTILNRDAVQDAAKQGVINYAPTWEGALC